MATSDQVKEWQESKQAGVRRMQSRQKIVHRKMAEMIESDPSVIEKAQQKLQARLSKSGQATCEIYEEWQRILETNTNAQIAAILRSDDEKYDQIKACAPFDFQNNKS